MSDLKSVQQAITEQQLKNKQKADALLKNMLAQLNRTQVCSVEIISKKVNVK